MKKLVLVMVLFLCVNNAFALSENSTSDCQSLSSSTSDDVVVSAGSESQDGESSGSSGSSQ
jgi:hypothetical protein